MHRSPRDDRPFVVLGATGTLGAELCRQRPRQVLGLSRRRLDLRHPLRVQRMLREVRPRAVIHAAAATDVDWCQRHPRECFAVNATSVAVVAEACGRLNVPLVYVSSSFVFGQQAAGEPWRETDAPCPRNIYARSKFVGEQYARECPRHLIVRTCGLFHHRPTRRRGFVQSVLSQAAAGKRLRVVCDQWANPTYVPELARALWFLLSACLAGTAAWGIYHVVNGPAVTWHEFAQALVLAAGYPVSVEAIRTEEFPAVAPRPRFAALATEKYARTGGPAMSPWPEALAGCLRQLQVRTAGGKALLVPGTFLEERLCKPPLNLPRTARRREYGPRRVARPA